MYACARCGGKLKDKWIYSSWTKNRYCSSIAACDKRLQRQKKLKDSTSN